jgi:hypothetical protein
MLGGIMSYDDTNKGAVWKNETENPKAPVLKGECNIDGTIYVMSAWKNDTSQNPKRPVLSFAFDKKEQKISKKSEDTFEDVPW